MIIGIDGGFFSFQNKQKRGGVYQVGINLIDQLSKIDKDNEYKIYTFEHVNGKDIKFNNNFSIVEVRPQKLWNFLGLPLYFLTHRNKDYPDIFIGVSQGFPIICPGKKIVIIYDIAFQKYPNLYNLVDANKLAFQTRLAIKKADRIISISETTKRDLIKHFSVAPNKIKVLYLGYDERFYPSSSTEISQIKKTFKLPNSYFIFVGSYKKGKNIPFLIRCFDEFLSKDRSNTGLVLCGGSAWYDKEITETIAKSKFKNAIIKLDYVDRADLIKLYSGALAFVSPSLYEGFGLTFIEAMSCECPVIASTAGAIPEIVGEAGILVEANNSKQLIDSLFAIKNKELRNKLIKIGNKQKEKYSWENFSRGVLGEIKDLCPS